MVYHSKTFMKLYFSFILMSFNNVYILEFNEFNRIHYFGKIILCILKLWKNYIVVEEFIWNSEALVYDEGSKLTFYSC